jgi:signal transduction histidine kinase
MDMAKTCLLSLLLKLASAATHIARAISVHLMRTGLPVVVAMILVVTSFAASLAYSHFLMQRIDERALAISEDAVPGFKHIAVLRHELLRFEILVSEYVVGAPSTREDIEKTYAALLAGLSAYRSLPTSAAEMQLTRSISADLVTLNDFVTRALEEADGGSRSAALQTLGDSVRPYLLKIDLQLERLSSLNELQANASTEHILRARVHAMRIAATLGLLSLGIAVGATALVLQTMDARARLIEAHSRLLAERAKELEAFAGRVAHDLREPLHAVTLRVTTLKARNLDLQQHNDVDVIGRHLRRMANVIKGLLEFALAGASPGPHARADLAPVLHEVIASVHPVAEAASAELNVESFSPAQLACTPEALSSVLSNLLSNAIKYVREAEQLPHRVTVCVDLHPDIARIEVRDNGPGLPAGTEQVIFRPFVRLHTRQPGTGLGLATVKRLAEAYGGKVGVISELGKGSTFWVEFPRVDAPSSGWPAL